MTERTNRDAHGNPVFNPEKAADTPARFFIHKGVRLESRYGFAAEYKIMMRAVNALSVDALRRISSIFCDSKATHSYEVGGRATRSDLFLLQNVFFDAAGGHNGIYAGPLWLDPDWME